MAGLVPAIHVFTLGGAKDVDARHEAGHDEREEAAMSSQLSEEQKLMRQSCRDFVDDVVIPFIRGDWKREWVMTPEDRLPPEILQGAEKVGIRTLGVPEEFGGIELDCASEVQTFALIAEEIARGDSGLADKLVQNWKVAVLLRNLAPRHLQEKWFKRLIDDPRFLLAHC